MEKPDTSIPRIKPVQLAQLSWRGGEPYSDLYDDVYFSKENGFKETQYVFIEGNDLKKRWQLEKPEIFTIAETGFGSALNFLMVCREWLACSEENQCLHFVSVDKHPFSKEDLLKSYANFSELSIYVDELINHYPLLIPGMHRISLFAGRVKLTLFFGDIEDWLEGIVLKADAWFLDGFAPAKNESMWTQSVFKGIAKNTKPSGTLSTFTAASIVRKGLMSVGFDITKKRGFGNKREMLCGTYKTSVKPSSSKALDEPWFQYDKPVIRQKNITIIGAGLAGATTAFAFAERGWQVSLVERENKPALGASGNSAGIIYSKLSAYQGLQYQFFQQAFTYSLQWLSHTLADNNILHKCGLLQLAFDDAELQRQKDIMQDGVWPDKFVSSVDIKAAKKLAGLDLASGGLFFKDAGWVAPNKLCEYLIKKHNNIKLIVNTEAVRLKPGNKMSWQLYDSEGKKINDSEVVVIANAKDAGLFEQTEYLPLSSVRGQVTQVTSSTYSENLKTVVSYEGYITPVADNQHSLGATYNLRDIDIHPRVVDDEYNLKQLQSQLPNIDLDTESIINSRVGFRCQSPDTLPIVGPVPDIEYFIEQYSCLRSGMLKQHVPKGQYYPNLYVNVAHGSRGVTTTPLSAELLAAYVNNEPFPLDWSLVKALQPARFPIKWLKKNKI